MTAARGSSRDARLDEWQQCASALHRRDGLDYLQVQRSVAQADAEYKRIAASAETWISSDYLADVYAKNRAWFTRSPVEQSSAFAYAPLAEAPDVVERVRSIQCRCGEILGDGWRPVPVAGLHMTLFTATQSTDLLPPGVIRHCEARFGNTLARVRPFLLFVLGPRMARGAVILECRAYEPTFTGARRAAAGHGAVSVPRFEHVSLGYICGGSGTRLRELQHTLRVEYARFRSIATAVAELRWARTINKQIAGEHASTVLVPPKPDAGKPDIERSYETPLPCDSTSDVHLQRLLESVSFTWGYGGTLDTAEVP